MVLGGINLILCEDIETQLDVEFFDADLAGGHGVRWSDDTLNDELIRSGVELGDWWLSATANWARLRARRGGEPPVDGGVRRCKKRNGCRCQFPARDKNGQWRRKTAPKISYVMKQTMRKRLLDFLGCVLGVVVLILMVSIDVGSTCCLLLGRSVCGLWLCFWAACWVPQGPVVPSFSGS